MIDNEYHLLTFDPGAAATGWTWFVVDFHAFSRPENKLLSNIKSYDFGEFRGNEIEMYQQCVDLVRSCLALSSYLTMEVLCEGFELTQIVGSTENLLSPVRIATVLKWECHKAAVPFRTQSRTMRTGVTRDKLKLYGFEGPWRKDEYAAMQHAVTYLRTLKQATKGRPWKLSKGGVLNAGGWDCACSKYKRPCNMRHPR